MRQALALLLAGTMVAGLVSGCGSKGQNGTETGEATSDTPQHGAPRAEKLLVARRGRDAAGKHPRRDEQRLHPVVQHHGQRGRSDTVLSRGPAPRAARVSPRLRDRLTGAVRHRRQRLHRPQPLLPEAGRRRGGPV